jgi:hypothetical protein
LPPHDEPFQPIQPADPLVVVRHAFAPEPVDQERSAPKGLSSPGAPSPARAVVGAAPHHHASPWGRTESGCDEIRASDTPVAHSRRCPRRW